jgi:ketosteroid isomerase-like protein
MTGRRTSAVVAVCAVLAGACAHRPAASPEAERAALEQRQAGFLAAVAARDADRAAAFFAADAVLHIAGMPPVQGRTAIGAFYGNVFRFMAASRSTPASLRISSSGGMAWAAGSVVNSFQADQGTVEHAGKYLLVWEQHAGEWWIAAYGISSNQADAGRP